MIYCFRFISKTLLLLLMFSTGNSQPLCSNIFAQYSEVQFVSEIEYLVQLKLKIDQKDFENESQLSQAQEKLVTDLRKIVNIDKKYLHVFNQKYNEIHSKLSKDLAKKRQEKNQKEKSYNEIKQFGLIRFVNI